MAPKPERTETRTLSCDLTEKEVSTAAYDMALKARQVEELEAAAKVAAKRERDKATAIRAEMRVLARKVETRKEDRPVLCDVVFVDEELQVQVIRKDTGVIVQRRPMTDSERQKPLPVVAKFKTKK